MCYWERIGALREKATKWDKCKAQGERTGLLKCRNSTCPRLTAVFSKVICFDILCTCSAENETGWSHLIDSKICQRSFPSTTKEFYLFPNPQNQTSRNIFHIYPEKIRSHPWLLHLVGGEIEKWELFGKKACGYDFVCEGLTSKSW